MKRKSWLSFLLSLIEPGLGQMYNGELRKGILFYFFIQALSTPVVLIAIFHENRFLNILSLLSIIILSLPVAFEAFFKSKKIGNNFNKKKYNRWYFYITFYIISFCLVHYPIKQFAIKYIASAYKISSGYMENTLLTGDYLIANHLAYSLNKKPQINDIIVFKYSGFDEKEYIKRIIGKSGQNIKIIGNDVFVDGIKQELPPYSKHNKNGIAPILSDTFKFDIPSPGDNFKVDNLSPRNFLFLYYTARQENKDVEAELQIFKNEEFYKKFIFNKVNNLKSFERYIALLKAKKGNKDSLNYSFTFNNILKVKGETVSEYNAKSQYFFVMDDNRDNYLNQRYYDLVKTDSIKGKAMFLYMSINKSISLIKFWKSIRWSRIGCPIK